VSLDNAAHKVAFLATDEVSHVLQRIVLLQCFSREPRSYQLPQR